MKTKAVFVPERSPSEVLRAVCRMFLVLGAVAVLAFLCPLLAYGQNIHLQAVRVPNRLSHWPQSGFVDMVPPVRLPTNSSRSEKIMVWLRIPKGKKISVHWLADQKRYTLRFPPGTVTDRIDGTKKGSDAKLVIHDVRGAKIDSKGRTWWHVYEAAPGKSKKWLWGFKWLRSDDRGDMRAADSLIKLYFPGRRPKPR